MKLTIFCITIIVILIIGEIYFRNAKYNEPFFDNNYKLVKRKKNTEGIYKTQFSDQGYFKINNEGWNSAIEYFEAKDTGRIRIAIVGHSEVEGLRVNVSRTFPRILEKILINKGIKCEVYTFGFASMHLAQALHVSRYVTKKFHPDVLIIGTLIDNCLLESSNRSFLNLSISKCDIISEILPNEIQEYAGKPNKFKSILFCSKLIRFLCDKCGQNEKTGRYYEEILLSNNDRKLINNYLSNEFLKLSHQYKTPVLFLKFPFGNNQIVNSDITGNSVLSCYNVYPDLSILDFDRNFMKKYCFNKSDLYIPLDGHYNENTHYKLGILLADYLTVNILHR